MDRLIPRLFPLFLSLVLISLVACAESEPPPAPRTVTGSLDYTNFTVFWRDFRSAILNEDGAAVAELTRFPLPTRGDMDEDPVVPLTRDEFIHKLPILLAEDPGIPGKPRTQKGLIKETPQAQPDFEGSARVGNFEFETIDGRWWFVFAYVGADEIQ